jgi:hypothetical protein
MPTIYASNDCIYKNNTIIVGSGNAIYGSNNIIRGNGNRIVGNKNRVDGHGNNVNGDENIVSGNGNNVTGKNCYVVGVGNVRVDEAYTQQRVDTLVRKPIYGTPVTTSFTTSNGTVFTQTNYNPRFPFLYNYI